MNNDASEIQINKILDTDITGVVLYNYLGQKIKSWDTGFNDRYNSLPVSVATGVYIVQINTSDGVVNKKLFIERK
ncbi:MAG: T9SS type A sorting domain-containing protein [Flavobacteriaceae bacterium]|nr:T9SS type A sorting domain-containing protein [Flavobacteriaceae bacterium]